MLGDPDANNALCFGVTGCTYPATNGATTTLTSTQYANQTIRPTGTAPVGTGTFEFPDKPGGYTKYLDLTQVVDLSNTSELVINAGGGGGAKETFLLGPVPTIYTIVYDGTTISVSKQVAQNGIGQNSNPSSIGMTSAYQTICTQEVFVGPTGTLVAMFSGNVQFADVSSSVDFYIALTGGGNSPVSVITSPDAIAGSFYIAAATLNWLFTGLSQDEAYTVSVMMKSTSSTPSHQNVNQSNLIAYAP